MLTERFISNLASTTVVNGGMQASPPETLETVTVEEADGIFPSIRYGEEQFHFKDRNPRHGGEIFTCIGTDDNHWQVVRGAEGTIPVSHDRRFTIRQVMTAEFLQRLGMGSTTELCNAVTGFGADSTGETLSGAAISQALDSGPVYLPTGIYSIQLPINMLPGQSMISFGNAVIRPTADFEGDTAIELIEGAGVTRLDSITLDGSELPAGSDAYGIFAETKVLEAELRRVRIYGFSNSGMIASGTGWMLERVTSSRNFGSGYELDIDESLLLGCRALENNRYGFTGIYREQVGCLSKGNKLGDFR